MWSKDRCHACLALLQGLAICVQQYRNEAPNEIARLKVGSYFGEVKGDKQALVLLIRDREHLA